MTLMRTMMAGSLLLLSLGCREIYSSPRSTPLSGSHGLQRFEGRFYDSSGNLIGIIHAGRNPRFEFRLPAFHGPYILENARWRGDELLFNVRTVDRTKPVPVSVKFLDSDRVVMSQVLPQRDREVFLCGNAYLVFPTSLIRNPPPMWFVRLRARQATYVTAEIARKVHDGIFDWLARRL